jgi:hypothetical protein
VLIELGGLTVAVESDSATVHEVLAEFYPPADRLARPLWTVTAVAEAPPPGVTCNRYGVGYRANVTARTVQAWSTREGDLAITTRKCVREVFLDRCERAGYTMLHASAIYRDDQVVLFAADKRGGKTTLALRSVLDHGWRWLSNDHLIVYLDGAQLMATSLPTPIPVKVGTFVDLAGRLPPPWDDNGVDLAAWRDAPATERYAADTAVYYTFARLGQPNPVVVPLAGRRLTVVFPYYVAAGQPEGVVEQMPAADGASELAAHVRTDWVTDDRLHQRHLPFVHRDVAAFARDGARLAAVVAGAAHAMLRWGHCGDPAPLLAELCSAGAHS